MTKTALPPKVETSEELSYQKNMLTLLKTVDWCLKFCTTKTIATLTEALICDTYLNTKSAPATIHTLENRGLLKISPDGTVEATKAFPRYMKQLRKNIALAENTEKIISPFSYFSKKFPDHPASPEGQGVTS